MGQILVPGTWGQGVPGTADKGPTWAAYRGAFQAGYSLAPPAPLSWLEGGALEGGPQLSKLSGGESTLRQGQRPACLLGQTDLNRKAFTISHGRQGWGTQKIPSCVTPDLSLGAEEEPETRLLGTQWWPSAEAQRPGAGSPTHRQWPCVVLAPPPPHQASILGHKGHTVRPQGVA